MSFMACRKMLQAFFISSSEMVKGGAMRRALSQNKNQSVIRPLLIQRSMTDLTVLKSFISRANMKPMPLNSMIKGCFNKDLNKADFSGI